MVRDITDQRRAEAGLQESNDRLEERVKARTEELVRLGEEFKEEATERIRAQEEASRRRAELAHLGRVRSTGELAASIAHELNQPLAAVLTNAQAALRLLEKKKPDLEELHEILVDIVADDKRAGHVIRRLRTLFQKGPIAQETVQLEELVAGVVPLVRSGAQGANARINVKSAPNLPPVEVDPVQIQQVVMNLLANSIDAIQRLDSDRGDSDGGDIDVEISRAGENGVLVTVRDNGPGLPAEEIGDVFKPFVTTKPGGMGMGLAICKSILDAHGGTISVENNVSGGCCFSFTLPLKQPALNQVATS
jgi:C4-dicarboxylate-specific signal transduction histidine kinase